MNAIDFTGDIDEQDRLIVFLPHEDEAGIAWAAGIARQWAEELRDPGLDIYTIEDWQPVNGPR